MLFNAESWVPWLQAAVQYDNQGGRLEAQFGLEHNLANFFQRTAARIEGCRPLKEICKLWTMPDAGSEPVSNQTVPTALA